MLLIILLYFLKAQHVLGTTMSIVRSLRLQCWLPHWSFNSWFAVGWRLGAVRLEKCPDRRLKHDLCFNLQLWYFLKNLLKIEILSLLHSTGISCWVLIYCYNYPGNRKIWCMFNLFPMNAPDPFKSASYESTKWVPCGHLNVPHSHVQV